MLLHDTCRRMFFQETKSGAEDDCKSDTSEVPAAGTANAAATKLTGSGSGNDNDGAGGGDADDPDG